MDDYIPEGNTPNARANKEEHEKIGLQMNNCVCKIGDKGSGFFVKISNNKKAIMKVLISNNHVITTNNIENSDKIIYNFEGKEDRVIKKLDKRKIYTNENMDITIIEINEDDQLKDENFLELDDIKFDENKDELNKTLKAKYKEKAVYNISFPNSKEVVVSYGKITDITNQCKIYHDCDTHGGSSGSPILSIYSFKVIGFHCGAATNIEHKNVAQIIFHAINEFLDKKDSKTIITKVNKEKKMDEGDNLIIKKIASQDSTGFDSSSNLDQNTMRFKYKVTEFDDKIRIFGKKFVENNKTNCKIKLNGKTFELTEYLQTNQEIQNNGYIKLELIIINKITDMSYMFGKCFTKEKKIPLEKVYESNWNTKNVTNMSKMFCGCDELIYLPDLKAWNTENVKNMSFMFFGCEKLALIEGISEWNTKNVENMSNMFAYCKNLISLPDFGNWKMEKVKDISYMFYECKSLENIYGLEHWKLKSLKYDDYLLIGCESFKDYPKLYSKNNSSY